MLRILDMPMLGMLGAVAAWCPLAAFKAEAEATSWVAESADLRIMIAHLVCCSCPHSDHGSDLRPDSKSYSIIETERFWLIDHPG
jgi:hypothetical protein